MNNPRMSAKERNLLKGAIRRVFSRSELRRKVLDAARIDHYDPNRPRVKSWCICNICKQPEACSYMVVDHVTPIIPVSSTLELLSWDVVINNTWCDESNLQAIDEHCHKIKTKAEAELRKEYKKKGLIK